MGQILTGCYKVAAGMTLSALTLTGCSQLTGGSDTTKPAAQATAGGAPVKEGAAPAQGSNGAAQGSTGDQAQDLKNGNDHQKRLAGYTTLPAPVATLTSSGLSEGVDKITWEVYPLRRKDKIVIGVFKLTFEGPNVDGMKVSDALKPVRDMNLYDTKNMMIYRELHGPSSNYWSTLKNGDSIYLTRVFGAPDADTVQLLIHQNVGWVTDMKIS